eukprot:gene52193-31064_t
MLGALESIDDELTLAQVSAGHHGELFFEALAVRQPALAERVLRDALQAELDSAEPQSHCFVASSGLDGEKLTDAQVRSLHRRAGHPPVDRLVQFIRDARGDAAAGHARGVLEKLQCDICTRRGTKQHGAPSLERVLKFNDEVVADSIMLGRLRGRPVWAVNHVDRATRLSAGGLVTDRTALAAARVTTNEWVLRFGAMDALGSDGDGEFTGGDYTAMCEEFGIRKFVYTAEHPDAHGIIERFNRTIQDTFNRINDDTPCKTLADYSTVLLTVYNEPAHKGDNPFRGPAKVIGATDHNVYVIHNGGVINVAPADVRPIESATVKQAMQHEDARSEARDDPLLRDEETGEVLLTLTRQELRRWAPLVADAKRREIDEITRRGVWGDEETEQVRPQGLQEEFRPQGLQEQLRPQGRQEQRRPQGLQEQVRPKGLQEQLRPQGLQEELRPQGPQEQLRPQGLQEQMRP